MKIAVIDDYQNAFKTLKCFPKLSGHEVVDLHRSGNGYRQDWPSD